LLLLLLQSHLLLLLLLLHRWPIHCSKPLHILSPCPSQHASSSTRLLRDQLPQLFISHLIKHCLHLRGRPALLYRLLQQQRVAAQLLLLLLGWQASREA
jgi:hypothetical protein